MKKLMVLVAASLMLMFCSATVSQAVTLSFDPDFQEVLVGDPANVDLVISELGVSTYPSLGEFDLDISFDPAILGFNSVTFGDPILGDQLDIWVWGINSMGASVTSPGVLDIFEVSLDTVADLNYYQADSFILATLTFDTLALGTSSLGISIDTLGDAWGDPLTADLESGSIDVVPEPATLLLLGTGLAGIGFLRKKKKNQVS